MHTRECVFVNRKSMAVKNKAYATPNFLPLVHAND